MRYLTDGKRHLVCLPYSVEGLHKMAEDLGISKAWFHKNHYDIPKRRQKDIEAWCILVSSKDIVNIIRGYKTEITWEEFFIQYYKRQKDLWMIG